MKSQRVYMIILAMTACVMLAGCMPRMTIEEMRTMMPERPAELDKLNAFVGRWEYTGEANMAKVDKPIPTSGHGETRWDDSRWFLVGNSVFSMEGFDEMHGHDTWTYDTKTKKYRSTWTDSMGTTGTGTAKYDEKTKTWNMRATSQGAQGKTTAKGFMKIIDDNTMEWCWTEYAMGGLMKTMEMCGTSKRK